MTRKLTTVVDSTQAAIPSVLMTPREVGAFLRISESALIALRARDATFPKPRRVGEQKLVYMRTEIMAYVEALPRIGDTPPARKAKVASKAKVAQREVA